MSSLGLGKKESELVFFFLRESVLFLFLVCRNITKSLVRFSWKESLFLRPSSWPTQATVGGEPGET